MLAFEKNGGVELAFKRTNYIPDVSGPSVNSKVLHTQRNFVMMLRANLHMMTACKSLAFGTPQTAVVAQEFQHGNVRNIAIVRVFAGRIHSRNRRTNIAISNRFDLEDAISLGNTIKGLKDSFQKCEHLCIKRSQRLLVSAWSRKCALCDSYPSLPGVDRGSKTTL
jgi:hypothetical protein